MTQRPKANPASARPRRISSALSLADLLRGYLDKNRTTAAKLCRKADILPSIVSKVLSGRQRYLDAQTVDKLAKATGIDLSRLYRAMRNSKSASVDKSTIERCIDRAKSKNHNI